MSAERNGDVCYPVWQRIWENTELGREREGESEKEREREREHS